MEKGYMMGKQISILAIEDEEHIRNILKYNLKLDGFEVCVAENGRKGLELAREKIPDVILLDWMIPEMDGLEVLSELKKDERTENIPVFMLTAKAMAGDLEQALREGANDYITKPFDSAKLGQLIKFKLENLVKT
ncbi:MAG: response regulator [Planctomycetota bacterium]